MSKPTELSPAEKFLSDHDPVMAELIAQQGDVSHAPRDDYFESLTRSITGQQISVSAAASIFARFQEKTQLDPAKVLELTDDDMRAIGFSRTKEAYIRDLAQHFVDDSAIFNHLGKLSDDEVIAELTRIKGIGVWTAQMFLMFTLARADVFAADDRGLQLAVEKNYNMPPMKRAELEKFAERWKPYRTLASWHLWKSLDNAPV